MRKFGFLNKASKGGYQPPYFGGFQQKFAEDGGGGFQPDSVTSNSPLSIFGSNTLFWHRTTDISAADLSGSDIVTWRDLSGNGRNLSQGTSARRFAFVSSVINGKPVARPGTAGDDRFMSWTPFAGPSKGAVYAVVKMRTKAGSYQTFLYWNAANLYLGGAAPDPENKPFLYTNAPIAAWGTALTDQTVYLVKWAWDDTTETCYVRVNDAAEVSQVSGVGFVAGNFSTLGMDPGVVATQDLFSDIGDVWGVSGLPTAAQDAAVFSYVRNFWGPVF